MAYGDFKDLPRLALIKYYVVKHLILLKKTKYDGYQGGLASVLNFLIKKASGSGVISKIMPNQQLSEELHKPIIRKFEKKINKSLLIF